MARPLALQPADQGEEVRDVFAGQAAGRLVEHEHAALDGHGAGDLDHLLLGQRKLADLDLRRHVVRCRPRASACRGQPPGLAPADQRPAGRLDRPGGCSPSPKGAAPAKAPGRSSPRRSPGRPADCAEHRARRRATSGPASGPCAPERTFISVLLPAPFSPTRAWTSPALTARSTPPSARVAPKRLCTPRMARRTDCSEAVALPGVSVIFDPHRGRVPRRSEGWSTDRRFGVARPPLGWGKRGQSPLVRSTLRAVPANGDCPLLPGCATRLARPAGR